MHVKKVFYFIDLKGGAHKFLLKLNNFTAFALHEGKQGRLVALFDSTGKTPFFYESVHELREHPEWSYLVNFLRRTGN